MHLHRHTLQKALCGVVSDMKDFMTTTSITFIAHKLIKPISNIVSTITHVHLLVAVPVHLATDQDHRKPNDSK
jgi:hypothetical protein